MTAQELKEKLKEEDIRKLLIEMGATFYYEDDDMWITDTICHHGTKPKLYYYKDSMSFHCYTECGQLDIIGVVMGYKDYEQEEFQKAINWICVKLNLDNCEYGFGKQEQISDWEFIRKYKGLFDVTINVPAEFIGDSTQEDLDKTAAEYGFKITLNDDGSATYVMTKSQHEKLMKEYADNLNASLAEMVGSEDYPNITDIKANSDFTSFTITTKNTEPDMAESMSTISLYMMAGVYNIFNGTPVENVHIDFVNADTGEVISSSDSADSGSDSE